MVAAACDPPFWLPCRGSFCFIFVEICIIYKWPECMFQLEHLFEGQVDMHGTVTTNASGAKAVDLQETKNIPP